MTLKIIKVILVIGTSVAIIWFIRCLMAESFDFKMAYYKVIQPVMKY